MIIRVAVLTISDRSYRGMREDLSGPALLEQVNIAGWQLVLYKILPDDFEMIVKELTTLCEGRQVDIILTTGGTGFALRDVTPEATNAVIEKNAQGIAEAMRAASMKITPHAMLSRATAGIRKETLIINLPGSPRAAVENLSFIINVLPHAVDLLRGNPDSESGHLFEN